MKDGLKYCSDCGDSKPQADFAPSQGICSLPCLKIKRNIHGAARAENMLDWYHEQRSCPKRWKKVKHWSTKQVPKDKAGNSNSLPMLQYKSNVRAVRQQVRDGMR